MTRYWGKIQVLSSIADELKDADYKTTLENLSNGEYTALNLEKLHNTDPTLFSIRVKGEHRADRLLCITHEQDGINIARIVAIVKNHQYDKALRKSIPEDGYVDFDTAQEQTPEVSHVEPQMGLAAFYNGQVLSLTDPQKAVYDTYQLPLLINGTAGSGKTFMSELLIKKAIEEDKTVYYFAPSQNLVDFMTRSIDDIPDNLVITTPQKFIENKTEKQIHGLSEFTAWSKGRTKKIPADISEHDLYNEICIAAACDDENNYVELGNRQSSIANDQRVSIYSLMECYQEYLQNQENGCDPNIQYIDLGVENDDEREILVVVDESQSLSNNILRSISRLATNEQVSFLSDSNQSMINPVSNVPFIKALFSGQGDSKTSKVTELGWHYSHRCPSRVVSLGATFLESKRRLLKEKATSNLKTENLSHNERKNGRVYYHNAQANIEKVATGIKKNMTVNTAIAIPDESFREQVSDLFGTDLVFTPQQILGLEYENIIMYKMFTKKLPKGEKSIENNSLSANEIFVTLTRSKANLFVCEDKPHGELKTFLENEETLKLSQRHIDSSAEKEADSIFASMEKSTLEEIKEEIKKQMSTGNIQIAKDLCERFFSEIWEVEYCKLEAELKPVSPSQPNNDSDAGPSNKSIELKPTTKKKKKQKKRKKKQLEAPEHGELLMSELMSNIRNNKFAEFTQTIQQSKFTKEVVENQISKLLTYSIKTLNDKPQKIMQFLPILLETQHINVNYTDKDGRAPLHFACVYDHKEIAELLIEKNANLDVAIDTAALSGCTPFHLACEAGHIKIAEMLVQERAKIDIAAQNGCTPLYCACQNGHEGIVRMLIEKGADTNTIGKGKYTLLHITCEQGHDKLVEMLIEKIKDIDAIDENRCAPLHLACRNGHAEIVKILIQRKARVDVATQGGYTPLHIVCLNDHAEIAKILIEKVDDIDAITEDGCTPLHLACYNGHERIVEMLIEKGTNVDAATQNGDTALSIARKQGHKKIVEILEVAKQKNKKKQNDTPEDVKSLMVKLMRNIRDIDFQTFKQTIEQCDLTKEVVENQISKLLTYSIKTLNKKHQKIVQFLSLLLKMKHINVNFSDTQGSTPLHIACLNGHTEIAEMLIEKGANIDALTLNECTQLHLSCGAGNIEIVKMLIKKRAKVDVAAQDGCTSLYFACQIGYEKIARILIKGGANTNTIGKGKYTLLHIASEEGHDKIVEMLIKKGADINATSQDKKTPLHLACQNGHKKIAELLIEKVEEVDAINEDGCTPLHLACLTGQTEIAQILIRKEARVDITTQDGHTPLHLACYNGHEKIAELLVEKVEEVDAINEDGCTPLHLTCQNGHEKIVEILIKKGAKVDVATQNGDTALSLARKQGHDKIVEMLQAAEQKDIAGSKEGSPVTPQHDNNRNTHETVTDSAAPLQPDSTDINNQQSPNI